MFCCDLLRGRRKSSTSFLAEECSMSTVGFIGLGTMGQHMARNVLKAGHSLVFYARRQEVIDEFSRAGGKLVASPAEVARAAEFIISIVTADAQVEEVALGPQGVIHGATPGKIFIDMSTIGPATVRRVGDRLRAAGLAMIDAPVSGGPWGAEAGTLAIMVGGESADFERCRPLLTAMGKHIFHVGPLGAGQIVKLVNQMVGGGIMTLIAEGFVLAKAAGADLNQLADVMAVSSANSAALEARGKKFLLANNYTPGFMTDLMRKDVKLAGELARQLHVATPVADAALAQYDAAIDLGLGKQDFASVVKVCERAAGVKIASDVPRLIPLESSTTSSRFCRCEHACKELPGSCIANDCGEMASCRSPLAREGFSAVRFRLTRVCSLSERRSRFIGLLFDGTTANKNL